jgi:uncharacterized membrane protein YdbT with pleckstrin-like domain
MPEEEQRGWYYASANNERLGPVSIQELSALAGRGEIAPATLVWSAGYPAWIPAADIADLLTAARAPAAPASPLPPAVPAVSDESPAATPEIPSPPPSAAEPLDIKPRKGSFLFRRILLGLLFSTVVGAITAVVLATADRSPWPGLALILAGSFLTLLASFASYRKERYEIHESRLLCHRGGLVSDEKTELEIRNITHVKLKLPWLRYKLHGVGDVVVESAGNSQAVVLRSIHEPRAVYAGLQDRMKRQGYDLTRRQLLHEERPALIGIIGECLGLLSGAVVLGLFIAPHVLEVRDAAKSPTLDSTLESSFPLIAVLIALVLVAAIILRFLDFRRRVYRVYNDVVVYEEGFLTRHDAFIPYENIADANTKSSFFDRLFGLFDVQISCQGSGSEIKFRRLKNGIALSGVIDQLVVEARRKEKPAARPRDVDPARTAPDRPRRHEPAAIPVGEAMVAELRMHAGRTFVPLLLLLPLFPLWILAMIQSVIRLSSTRYSVRPGSIRHSYRFLTLHDREFAYDKITGLVIKRNLWDRMFDTLTIRFWSLGSGQPLEFAHVHAGQFDLPALMRQAGIPAASSAPCVVEASFGVMTWLRARLNALPLVLILAAAIVATAVLIDPVLYSLLVLLVLAPAGACLWSGLYHARQRLRFHEHHVEAEQGLLARRSYHARYANVKRIRHTRYPGGTEGSLEIFVAGEEEVGQGGPQQKNRQTILRPCSFTSGFLPDVAGRAALLDDILCGRVDPAPQAVAAEPLELLMEARRSPGNAVLKLVLLSILLLPLVVLLPLTLPFVIIGVKRWRYRVEDARVVTRSGIFYRSETSILLDRVDSLQQSQGPLNKMFKNGNVRIMTAGSSKPDLSIIDSPDYLALYQVIRERSR